MAKVNGEVSVGGKGRTAASAVCRPGQRVDSSFGLAILGQIRLIIGV